MANETNQNTETPGQPGQPTQPGQQVDEQEEKGRMRQENTLRLMGDVSADILKFQEERKATKEQEKLERIKNLTIRGERLRKDEALRAQHDATLASGYAQQMGTAFLAPYNKYVKRLYKDYYKAVKKDDNEARDKAFSALKILKQEIDAIKSMKQEYADNMFGGVGGGSKLSKGCSAQQISIADQLYTQNPELRVEIIGDEHLKPEIMMGFYGQPLKKNEQYGIVEDFDGNKVYVNMKEGNKDLFTLPYDKALEYQEARKKQADIASEAVANNQAPKLNIGDIAYQMDKLFVEKETVLSFTHDDMLEDGSTFKQHLYNHKDLTRVSYEDFILLEYDENRDGVIDDEDRARVVDAITNVDNPYFDIELLRELVTDYYTKKIYIAWGKNMGFKNGWIQNLENNRRMLNVSRFKIALEKARKQLQPVFMFDGKEYDSGIVKPTIEERVGEYRKDTYGNK